MKFELLKLIVIVVVFGAVLYENDPFEPVNCKRNRFREDDVLNGSVVKKVRNSNSHSNELIFLSDKELFEWENDYYQKDSFFHKINIGDSLVKEEGSLILKVYKKDTSFNIDLSFPCEED